MSIVLFLKIKALTHCLVHIYLLCVELSFYAPTCQGAYGWEIHLEDCWGVLNVVFGSE